MNIELWKLILSVGVLLVSAVTGPIIWAISAEAKNIRAENKLELERKTGEIKLELAGLRGEMSAMEVRLNQRIDTRLVHR